MLEGVVLSLIGLAMFAFGHLQNRLQIRALGIGLAAFGVTTFALTAVLG